MNARVPPQISSAICFVSEVHAGTCAEQLQGSAACAGSCSSFACLGVSRQPSSHAKSSTSSFGSCFSGQMTRLRGTVRIEPSRILIEAFSPSEDCTLPTLFVQKATCSPLESSASDPSSLPAMSKTFRSGTSNFAVVQPDGGGPEGLAGARDRTGAVGAAGCCFGGSGLASTHSAVES